LDSRQPCNSASNIGSGAVSLTFADPNFRTLRDGAFAAALAAECIAPSGEETLAKN
jgi:hypothetical protein